MLKRCISLLVSICLLLSMIPTPAYAQEADDVPASAGSTDSTAAPVDESTRETEASEETVVPFLPQVIPTEIPDTTAAVPQAESASTLQVSVLPDKVIYYVGDTIDLTGLELLLTLSSGTTQTVTISDGITLVSGDTSASGRVAVTVSYAGLQTQFEIGVHTSTKEDVLQDNAGYPQSSHNYANNTDIAYTYTVEGAEYLKLTFSSSTKTEEDYDYIYLYDSADTLLGKYTGTELRNDTIQVTGDTVRIRLTSDSSSTAYGFSFSSIYAYLTVPVHEKADAGVYTDPTCSADGYYTHTCSICSYTWDETDPGTASHTMDTGVYTDPTCTADGYTTYTCTVCGTTEIAEDTGSALGHTHDAGVYTDPSCFADGYTTYTCIVCGATEVAQDTGSAYHVFENGACTVCGVADTVVSGGWISDTVYWAMLPNNVLYIGGTGTVTSGSWKTSASGATSLSFSEGITSIGSYAFANMTNLTNIRIPDHITGISSNAFEYCTGLKYMYIPASVASISGSSYSSSPFYSCSTSLIIYCEPASKPTGWGAYWNYRSSGYALTTSFGMTEADYLYWSTLDTTATTIVVPDYVTCVPDYGFRNNDTVKVITLGSGITSIGANTFYDCDALQFLFVPASVTKFNSSFCYSCGAAPKVLCEATAKPSSWGSYWNSNNVSVSYGISLEEFNFWSTLSASSTTVSIPEYVKSIPGYAFSGFSSITSVTIPDSVTTIGTYAFNNCDQLTTLELGSSVTSIGNYAFYDCDGLASVYIPESVQTISASSYTNSPFNGCASTLKIYCEAASKPSGWGNYWNYYASGSTLTTNYGIPRADYLFWSTLDASSATVVIPEGITSIPAYAFRGCTALTEVVIPESVTVIGAYAFTGCTSLSSITLPASLVSIKGSAFNNCSALTEVHVKDLAAWCAIAFSGSSSNPLYYGDLYLDGSLVTELVIPEGVTSIGDYAFYGSSVTSVTIPAGVTSIGSSAFYGSAITSVTIPASVTEIGNNAFFNCSSLETVYIEDLTAWCAIDFKYSSSNPLNYGDLYLNGSLVTELVIPEDVTYINKYAFYGASALTGVTIHSGLTGVGSDAFFLCSGLTYVNIQDLAAWCAIDFAGHSANPTYYAKNLRVDGQPVTQLVIPESADYIGSYTFSRCTGLTSVTIPAGVASIHDGAFSSCSGLTEVSIPSSVTEIGNYAFQSCASLTEIVIPSGVETIGAYAFQYCSTLSSVQLPDSLKTIGGYAFYQCKALSQIRIPDGVTTLDSYTFANCSALTDVEWPENLSTIKSNAFYYCTGLTELTFPAALTFIGSYAFSGCSALTAIHFTGDAPSIQSNTFSAVVAQAYYPYDASGWHDSVLQNYGGTLTWTSTTNAGITAQGTCGDSVTWVLDEDGTLLISGSGAMTDYAISASKTTAPWSAYVKSIQILVVDSGITYMGKYAFYGCTALTDVRFLGDKPEFSSYTFYGIRATATYKANNDTWVPGELDNYGGTLTWTPKGMSDDYLGYSSLTSTYSYWRLDTEGTLTLYNWDYDYNSYGGAPWYPYRHHLKKAVIDGNAVSSIGYLAFYGCTELTDLEIVYSGIHTIDNYAFQECTKLKNVYLGDRVSSIGKCAFYQCSSLESLFLPQDNSNFSIADYAFGYCTALKEITIPGGGSFGTEIFEGCTSLTSIYIGECDYGSAFKPSSTTFSGVTATVYYPRNSWSYNSTRGNYGGTLTWVEADFGYCGPDVWWSYDPDACLLTLSGTGAVCGAYFSGGDLPWGGFNEEILTIVVGEGIEKIPSFTFEYCENVHSILLPETLTSLALNAFNDCGSLNNLILPSSLECFRGTSSASNPNFIRCESLTDVYYFGTEEEWALIEDSDNVVSFNSNMTLHFLILDPGTATCTEPGTQAHYRYDDTSVYDTLYDLDRTELTELATVPALGHDLGEWHITKESTCTEAGVESKTCSRCDYAETNALPLAAHSYEESVVAPDCTNQGYTSHVCTACGDETRDAFVDALGHNYGEWITDAVPSCTEDGSAHRNCSQCNETESKAIAATGHQYSSVVTDPTCAADGYTTHTCAVCGDSYTDSVVTAPGHTWTEATCTAPKTCSVCSETEGEALGHDYVNGKCSRCGIADPDCVVAEGVSRIYGRSRVDTSIAIADQLKLVYGVEKFENIIVANAQDYPDALAGSYLASVKNAPILITNKNTHQNVAEYISQNLGSGKVYILGGVNAVSQVFEDYLKEYGIDYERVAGYSRYDTNLLILKAAGVSADQEILICTGREYADSLSASAAGLPILLVNKALNEDQKTFLATTSKKFIIVGGIGAVNETVEAELKEIGEVTRLAGGSRYETSVLVAERFVSDPDTVILAYAKGYPDGLCSGPLAIALNAPLILTVSNYYGDADAYVENIDAGFAVGGTGLISDEAVRDIFDLAADAVIAVK